MHTSQQIDILKSNHACVYHCSQVNTQDISNSWVLMFLTAPSGCAEEKHCGAEAWAGDHADVPGLDLVKSGKKKSDWIDRLSANRASKSY